jgi:hypothetical protein
MNREEARRIAEHVKPEALRAMLAAARNQITDWMARSDTNKSLSVGAMFNIFAHCRIDERTNILAKTNMIRTFGEYLPGYEKPEKRKHKLPALMHQEPVDYPPKESEEKK